MESKATQRHIRCTVTTWNDCDIVADSNMGTITVAYGDQPHLRYLKDLLRTGMTLNLLDTAVVPAHSCADALTVSPRLIVVEPDFLMEPSLIAACFAKPGQHPLSYTIGRMQPRPNTQAILLGNLAGTVLDDLINAPCYQQSSPQQRPSIPPPLSHSIRRSFREQALQFCACTPFSPKQFTADARLQAGNLLDVTQQLFSPGAYDRSRAVLEPSFVCPLLGLQGRVDLMTTDMRLIVEQKAGRNMRIEREAAVVHRDDHYVQLLLYYGILKYNFNLPEDHADISLLYSKYPAAQGLLHVGFNAPLFHAAMRMRNLLVAWEYYMAREGFSQVMPYLAAEGLLTDNTPLERDYFTTMMTFVYREQLYAKTGGGVVGNHAASDLWTLSIEEKRLAGTILTDLTLTQRQQSAPGSGYDLLTLATVPASPNAASESATVPASSNAASQSATVTAGSPAGCLPTFFRQGDSIYLYTYEGTPDLTSSILYKGTLKEITQNNITIQLTDGQQNPAIFADGTYAIEPAPSDASTGSHIRALFSLVNAPRSQRALLLGQREPQADTQRHLSQSYHPDYDELLTRAKQALDYFLIIGPPGTGKTSMAMRFLVEEETGDLLLTAYTNRAVDEICGMLTDAGRSYLRLGNESSCDPRFRPQLLSHRLGDSPHLAEVREMIRKEHIIVATTSWLQTQPGILQLKTFRTIIVDEASQLTEPAIVGLLVQQEARFILIGDYKQMPAVVVQPEAASKVTLPQLRDIALEDCRESLFQRLIRWERRQGRTQFIGVLNKQGRMHPDIAILPSRMFYSDEHLVPVGLPHQQPTAPLYCSDTRHPLHISDNPLHTSHNPLHTSDGPLHTSDGLDRLLQQHRLLFIPSPSVSVPEGSPEGRCISPPAANTNLSEARIVADVLARIHRFMGDAFDPTKSVGVIVPYRNQISVVRDEVERLDIPQLSQVSIDTVERYQGSQRDVIIYSFTATHPQQLEFLTATCFEENGHTIDRKLNVAITRARRQLIITGCPQLLEGNPLFCQLMAAAVTAKA